MSQLLVRLQQELHSATDVIRRYELNSRIAITLARSGRFAEAAHCIGALREAHVGVPHGPEILWVMLAEGVLQLYENIGPSALDRITRAQALAVAMGLKSIVGFASAWKAHIEFENSNFEAMAASLDLATTYAEAGDLDSATRIAIVLANSFALCGDFERSYRWFMHGRDAAVKNGDRVSIEALQYNKAALRLAWLRLENCKQAISSDDLRSIRTEIRSALAFQQLMPNGAYSNHLQLCEARLLLLECDFQSAIDRLVSVRRLEPFAEHNFSQDLVDLEISYCQTFLGSVNDAFERFSGLSCVSFDQLDIDDRIVAQWMRWKMAEVDDRFGCVRRHEYELARLIKMGDELRSRIRSLVQKFEQLSELKAS